MTALEVIPKAFVAVMDRVSPGRAPAVSVLKLVPAPVKIEVLASKSSTLYDTAPGTAFQESVFPVKFNPDGVAGTAGATDTFWVSV